MLIDGRSRVHIGTSFDQSACGIEIPVFGGDVEQGYTDQGCKRTGQGRTVFEDRRGCPDGCPDRLGIIHEYRRDGRVAEDGPALKQ
jgi:hypothetical protein